MCPARTQDTRTESKIKVRILLTFEYDPQIVEFRVYICDNFRSFYQFFVDKLVKLIERYVE